MTSYYNNGKNTKKMMEQPYDETTKQVATSQIIDKTLMPPCIAILI